MINILIAMAAASSSPTLEQKRVYSFTVGACHAYVTPSELALQRQLRGPRVSEAFAAGKRKQGQLTRDKCRFLVPMLARQLRK